MNAMQEAIVASPKSQFLGAGCECEVHELADQDIVCKKFRSSSEAELAYKRQEYAHKHGLAPLALFYNDEYSYYSEKVVPLSWGDFHSWDRTRQKFQDAVEDHMQKRFKALYGVKSTDMHMENIGVSSDGLVMLDFGTNSFARFGPEIKTY